MELPEELGAAPHPVERPARLDKIIGGARLVGRRAPSPRPPWTAPPASAPPAPRWPERPLAAGAAALGGHMIVRWSTPLDLPDLNRAGLRAAGRARARDTTWDDVLVVLARSDDGVSLDLQLEPRRGPVAHLPLTFTNLEPGRAYRLECSATASRSVEGGAVTVDLPEARRFRLVPEATA